ncbi:MAG: VCBS repeat-containing protein [Clostridia bacterium]|nr:VCBS repeat-containing protein [Clostridia bacterium]
MCKRFMALVVCLFGIMCLSGCDLFAIDTAELLSPPMLSGELKPIADVINKTAGDGYSFKYPSRGDYRSAVVREDIDGDGILEAFAFYSVTDGETVTMHINAITKRNGEWVSVATQKIVAASVDKIDFCDLDGNGIKEILVGWEIYGTSEMRLAVYGFEENTLTQRMLQKYTHFETCDLDDDDKYEILLINADIGSGNTASLFALTDNGITQISACALDSTSKTFDEPIISTLSNGKPAVYIDEIKGVGAVTEVIFLEKGSLVNPLYSSETKETSATLRSVTFRVTDIAGDGIYEIPIQENVPSVITNDANEILYLTNWCSFNGETLTVQRTDMINVIDGYSYTVPARLIGKIAVLKNTATHIREIYEYNAEEETIGLSLILFKAVSADQWQEEVLRGTDGQEIMKRDDTVFVAYISDTAKVQGITIDTVKSSFSIFE